jgi:hypothetical protein
MALRDDPENRAGRREVLRSKTQKQGALSFGYFSLCTQRKVTRRRLGSGIQDYLIKNKGFESSEQCN